MTDSAALRIAATAWDAVIDSSKQSGARTMFIAGAVLDVGNAGRLADELDTALDDGQRLIPFDDADEAVADANTPSTG